ncbi:MAG TPA: DNA-directed RNA polymerase subunit alpha C-terminal domain-containing protein [Candidatus Sulfotelmatobacter sp.]|nr:DNA-directed RNA polymerase subunit alpha C-terminal domain-containing protein [Candidatus Sulfotelmatobacter sp.]
MTDQSHQNDNAAFVYGMMSCPVLDLYRQPHQPPDRRLFFSYQLVETLLWMRLGLRVGYLSGGSLEAFLSVHESEVITAFSDITVNERSPSRLDVWKWAGVFDRLTIWAGTQKATINKSRLFQAGTNVEPSPLVLAHFQNMILVCSEAMLEEPTITFLNALNFADEERWMRVLQGGGGELSTQEVCQSVLSILSVLNDFAENGFAPQQSEQIIVINRMAAEILRWKLNFANATVSSRFVQAAEILRRNVGADDFGRCAGTIALSNFPHAVNLLMGVWLHMGTLEPVPEQIENKSIEELELSVRAYNALKNSRIETVGDLLRISETELLSREQIGQKTLNEVKEVLAAMGLRLGIAAANQSDRQAVEEHGAEGQKKEPDLEQEN